MPFTIPPPHSSDIGIMYWCPGRHEELKVTTKVGLHSTVAPYMNKWGFFSRCDQCWPHWEARTLYPEANIVLWVDYGK